MWWFEEALCHFFHREIPEFGFCNLHSNKIILGGISFNSYKKYTYIRQKVKKHQLLLRHDVKASNLLYYEAWRGGAFWQHVLPIVFSQFPLMIQLDNFGYSNPKNQLIQNSNKNLIDHQRSTSQELGHSFNR